MATQNSDNPKRGNAPVERFNDGAVKASIFRNISKDGRAFYNVTFTRIYTDPQTDEVRETQSFSGTDVLKVRRLADQAYHAVDRLKKQDRSQSKEHQTRNGAPDNAKGQSLSEQRDMLMDGRQMHSQAQDQAPQHGPEPSQ